MKKIFLFLAIGVMGFAFLGIARPISAACTSDTSCNNGQQCVYENGDNQKVCFCSNGITGTQAKCENTASNFGVTLPNPLCFKGSDIACSNGNWQAGGYSSEQSCNAAQGNTCVSDFPDLISTIAKYVTGLIASISVIMFLYAGFLYLTSAGAPDKISKANKAVIYAVIGIGIALAGTGLVAVIQAVVGSGPS